MSHSDFVHHESILRFVFLRFWFVGSEKKLESSYLEFINLIFNLKFNSLGDNHRRSDRASSEFVTLNLFFFWIRALDTKHKKVEWESWKSNCTRMRTVKGRCELYQCVVYYRRVRPKNLINGIVQVFKRNNMCPNW